MKKIFNSLICALIFCLFFCLCASAQEVSEQTSPNEQEIVESAEGFNVEEYIKEKIIPIAVGVLTAIAGLLATLSTIIKALKGLKDAKDCFSKEAEERSAHFSCQSEELEKKTEELKEMCKDVPKLQDAVDNLEAEIKSLQASTAIAARILALGFSSSSEVVASGKGRQMNLLLKTLEKGEGVNEEA